MYGVTWWEMQEKEQVIVLDDSSPLKRALVDSSANILYMYMYGLQLKRIGVSFTQFTFRLFLRIWGNLFV